MIEIVGFTAELKDIKGGIANIGICRKEHTKDVFLLTLAFEAILKCMKDCNRNAFYLAMSHFVDDNEFEDACEFIEGAK